MVEQRPNNPEIEPLTRTQVLIAMGATAVILLVVSKLGMYVGHIQLLPLRWHSWSVVWGLAIGLAITLASSLIYRLWVDYRTSADFYLGLVLKPLVWSDLLWLGLLPGLSEELLFRGVMLPAFGLNLEGIIVSSLFFGILHLSSPKQWAYVVWATIVGMLLGFSAVKTGNLIVPITAHIVTNIVSSCIWKWEHSRLSDGTTGLPPSEP